MPPEAEKNPDTTTTLVTRTGITSDRFRRDDAAGAPRLVPFDALETALATNREVGVEIGNTVKAGTLQPHFARLALIAIAFPAYGDGRGYSIARQLRALGYTGTLRAVGPLIADQFHYALACGFDEIELPAASAARQPEAQWQGALAQRSASYQRGYAQPGNILERRRAQRGEG